MSRPFDGVPVGGWLSADELARRAELAARPDVPEAFDSDCPCCVAMRRTCAGHVELHRRPELAARIAEVEAVLARPSDCEACEGRGKVWEAQAGRWRACWACNAPPAYPGWCRAAWPLAPVRARWRVLGRRGGEPPGKGRSPALRGRLDHRRRRYIKPRIVQMT